MSDIGPYEDCRRHEHEMPCPSCLNEQDDITRTQTIHEQAFKIKSLEAQRDLLLKVKDAANNDEIKWIEDGDTGERLDSQFHWALRQALEAYDAAFGAKDGK